MSQSGNDLQNQANPTHPDTEQAQGEHSQIAIDGFGQVLEMLRVADPAFRESLLKRLAARDRELARDLRAGLQDN